MHIALIFCIFLSTNLQFSNSRTCHLYFISPCWWPSPVTDSPPQGEATLKFSTRSKRRQSTTSWHPVVYPECSYVWYRRASTGSASHPNRNTVSKCTHVQQTVPKTIRKAERLQNSWEDKEFGEQGKWERTTRKEKEKRFWKYWGRNVSKKGNE